MLDVDARGRSPSANQHLTLSIFPCTQQKRGTTNIYPTGKEDFARREGTSVLKFKPNDGYYLYNEGLAIARRQPPLL